jgi:hypothetical protein
MTFPISFDARVNKRSVSIVDFLTMYYIDCLGYVVPLELSPTSQMDVTSAYREVY